MDKNKKSKLILGPSGEKIVAPKSPKYFSELEREYIIQEYLSTRCTKREIWEKYTGQKVEHGGLLRWMRALGYVKQVKVGQTSFVQSDTSLFKKSDQMQKDKLTTHQESTTQELTPVELQNKIARLERELELAKMRAFTYSTMIDVAEKEFNIPIRKKSDTKP